MSRPVAVQLARCQSQAGHGGHGQGSPEVQLEVLRWGSEASHASNPEVKTCQTGSPTEILVN